MHTILTFFDITFCRVRQYKQKSFRQRNMWIISIEIKMRDLILYEKT